MPAIKHHNLFFDAPFEPHAEEIYDTKTWPINPLFYLSATSKTDDSVAPVDGENLFFLIPIAPGLEGDTEQLRNEYFKMLCKRLEKQTGQDILPYVTELRSYAVKEFKEDYNAFKGNAYGLANTLKQTAILKPRLVNNKLSNMFYCGQLSVPGPGVPPSLISGEIVAGLIAKEN